MREDIFSLHSQTGLTALLLRPMAPNDKHLGTVLGVTPAARLHRHVPSSLLTGLALSLASCYG